MERHIVIYYIIPYFILGFLRIGLQVKQKFSKIIFLFFIFFIGFRHQVGGDWNNYERMFESIASVDFSTGIFITEPLYALLNIIFSKYSWGIYGVNFICATLFMIGIYKFSQINNDLLLNLIVVMPYLGIVVAMGYTRQSVALALCFWGLVYLLKYKYLQFILLNLIAVLFHTSAFVMITFLIIYWNFSKLIKFLPIVMVIIPIMANYLNERYGNLYLSGEVESHGALLRLSINLLIAILFFMTHKFMKNKIDGLMLKVLSFLSFGSILLFFSSFFYSTIADRMGLYFSLIQPLYLTQLIRIVNIKNQILITLIIFVSYLLLLVGWLMFSPFAQGNWLPYNNLILMNL